MISGGTKNPAAAWTFIEWLSRQIVTTNSGPVYPGYLNARKSLDAKQTASESDDKQRQSDYEYTLAHLPVLANYPNQDFSVAYGLLGGISMLFENPPKTPEEVLATTVKQIQDNTNLPQTTPSPTPDIRPVIVATPEAQVAAPDQTAISFASYGTSLTDMRRALKNFKTQETGIFVKLIQTDNITTTMTISEAAQRSDCFLWNQNIPVSEQDIATLADMQPLLDADTTIKTSEVPQALLDIYRNNGRLIGFPHNYNTRGLVYQPALLSAVGLSAPTAEWTPADFLKAAKALTAKGVFGYSSMGNYTGDLSFWVNRFGGSLVQGTGKNVRANYNDPNTIKGIEWWLKLASEHHVMPKPVFDYRRDVTSNTPDPSWELQSQGKIAMWFDNSLGSYDPATATTDPASKPAFLAAMAPPPVGTIGLLSSDMAMVGYHIAATAANPQACMRLIDYLSQQSNVNAYGNIPARKAQAHDALFEEQNRYILPLRDALEPLMQKPLKVTGDSNSQYMVEQYWLIEALDTVLNKKADLAGALTKAQTATDTYLDCVAKITPNTPLGKGDTNATCAKKADPNYMGYMTDEATPATR
jgi:ABC-type glycerol-3-phosphate transport system substrate-binding protein